MFIWEWDKENVRVPFSDKDLPEIGNATPWVKTFQIAKSKHRQDVHDSRYTKTIHCFKSSIQNGRNLPDVRDLKNVCCFKKALYYLITEK